jgi:uracil DNA glycosylase
MPTNMNAHDDINDLWTFHDIGMIKPPTQWSDFFRNNIELLDDIDFVFERDKIQEDFVVPIKQNVFKCFELCNPENIKVIIFSSKPYSTMCSVKNIPLATGVPFSVPEGSPQPKALKNIIKCVSNIYVQEYNVDKNTINILHDKYENGCVQLKEDIEMVDFLHDKYVTYSKRQGNTTYLDKLIEIQEVIEIKHIKATKNLDNIYDLSKWYDEGVLLIDSCLTSCVMSNKNHGILWCGFLIKMLDYIISVSPHDICYVFWGKDAAEMKNYIKSSSIFDYCHPLNNNKWNNFLECDNFQNINETIKDEKDKIRWDVIFE